MNCLPAWILRARISSNKFLSSIVHGSMYDLPREGGTFWGLGELHDAKLLVTRGVTRRLLGGFGGMLSRRVFLNGAIWCVLGHMIFS